MYHLQLLIKVTRFLKVTANMGLTFTPASGDAKHRLRIYAPANNNNTDDQNDLRSISSDAYFANNMTAMKSISGLVITLYHTPYRLFIAQEKVRGYVHGLERV